MTQEPLINYLRSCCVQVLGQKPGCGFFIAPQLVVTCSHVVGRDVEKNSEIELEKWSESSVKSISEATVIANFPQDDIAFIRTLDPNQSFVPLDKDIHRGHELTAIGFPYIDEQKACDQFMAQYEGRTLFMDSHGRARADTKFKSGQVEAGFSGGPLLNLETSRVVGVVALSRDKYSDLGGWAIEIPVIERLLQECHYILPDTDPGWAKAVAKSVSCEERLKERLFGLESSASASNSRQLLEHLQKYKNWLAKTTSYFEVPMIDTDFSISEDWIVRNLASRKNGRDSIDAEVAAEVYPRIFLKGSSGSGKSTLMKRLANSFASIGKIVLYVNLPDILRIHKAGNTFEKAITLTAIDGSGINFDDIVPYIGSPDYLIADGLDECERHSVKVAEKLSKWAEGHSEAKVIVACRDGVATKAFHKWQHLEISPLKQDDVVSFSKLVINKLLPSKEEREGAIEVIAGIVDDSKMFGLLKDSPLFVGLIAHLASTDKEFINLSKTEIYTASIDLAYEHLTQREQTVEISKMRAVKVLGLAGQKLQRNPETTEDELTEHIAEELKRNGYAFHEADVTASRGIQFWKEQRVFTQHRKGRKAAIRFIHYSLCEYAAGQYASQLSDDELHVWLKDYLSRSSYQDVIYFASGLGAGNRIIQYILSNSCDIPEASYLLMAEIISASDEISENNIEAVIADVIPELGSSDVGTVLDCVEVLSEISPKGRNLVYKAVEPFLSSNQFWTRAGAVAVAASCCVDRDNIDLMVSTVNEVLLEQESAKKSATLLRKGKRRNSRFNSFFPPPSIESTLGNQVIVSVCNCILDSGADIDAVSQITDIVLSGSFTVNVSTTLHNKLIARIQNAIREPDCCNIYQWSILMRKVLKRNLNYTDHGLFSRSESFQKLIENKRSDKVFLQSIIRIIEDSEVDVETESFLNMISLGSLLCGMQILVMTETEWNRIGESKDIKSLDIVLKGMISLLAISSSRLLSEAKKALDDVERFFSYDLEEIKTSLQQNVQSWKQHYETGIYKDKSCSTPLFSQAANLSTQVKWGDANALNIPPQDLVESLQHPSQCVWWNAALLVKYGAGGDKAIKLAKECVGQEEWLKFESRKSDDPR
ncbi:MAG: trypsin-like peptidase domain-containing protein [Phormidesmis sp.]